MISLVRPPTGTTFIASMTVKVLASNRKPPLREKGINLASLRYTGYFCKSSSFSRKIEA